MSCLRVYNLGAVSYEDGIRYQDLLHNLCKKTGQNSVLIMEHFPTITLGKNSDLQNLLVSTSELSGKKISFVRSDRGGEITAHLPGQMVAYPIISLKNFRLTVRKYIKILEDSVICLLEEYGILPQKKAKHPGIWLADNKICALGVRIKERISTHGIALNINPELEIFRYIIPCGIHGHGVTSMLREITDKVEFADIVKNWVRIFTNHMCIDHYDIIKKKDFPNNVND